MRTRLSLEAHPRYRSAVEAFFRSFLEATPPTARPGVPALAELAMGEAFEAVAGHAYRHRQPYLPRPVDLELVLLDGRLVLTVTDYGNAYDPDHMPDPDPAGLGEGRGLTSLRARVDRFSYSSDGEKNVLTLEMSL